jgi:DNA-binding transcriptional LysR family regulator
MKTQLDLNTLLLLPALAESGSFTAAAERLGSNKTSLSLQIKALEQQLGVALFRRTTRQVSLTAEGQQVLQHCLPLLQQVQQQLAALRPADSPPQLTGKLVVSAPEDFSNRVLIPALLAFAQRHPALQFDLRSSDQVQDLIKQGIDLSIRIGWLQDSSYKAHKLGEFQQWLLAAPAYLAQHTSPQHPADLTALHFIAFSPLPTPLSWRFRRTTGSEAEELTVRLRSYFSTSSTQSVTSLLLAGAGLAVLPDYTARPLIQSGQLQHVLSDWQLPGGGIYAVYPPGQHRSQPVRQFMQFFQRWLAEHTSESAMAGDIIR